MTDHRKPWVGTTLHFTSPQFVPTPPLGVYPGDPGLRVPYLQIKEGTTWAFEGDRCIIKVRLHPGFVETVSIPRNNVTVHTVDMVTPKAQPSPPSLPEPKQDVDTILKELRGPPVPPSEPETPKGKLTRRGRNKK